MPPSLSTFPYPLEMILTIWNYFVINSICTVIYKFPVFRFLQFGVCGTIALLEDAFCMKYLRQTQLCDVCLPESLHRHFVKASRTISYGTFAPTSSQPKHRHRMYVVYSVCCLFAGAFLFGRHCVINNNEFTIPCCKFKVSLNAVFIEYTSNVVAGSGFPNWSLLHYA